MIVLKPKLSKKMYKLISAYGFGSWHGLFISLFPSVKYGTFSATISISAVCTAIAATLGFSPLIAVVMVLAVFVETTTGILASRKRGEHFESWKFSRCILKVVIWLAALFITHAFSKEMSFYSNIIYAVGAWAFDALHLLLMVFFCVEYLISILENLAVLDGKDKTAYIEAAKAIFTTVAENIKNIRK